MAEFNFQSDFRDRTSSLETLMAVLQRFPETKIVVLYDKEYDAQFARLTARFSFDAAIAFPVDVIKLESIISRFD